MWSTGLISTASTGSCSLSGSLPPTGEQPQEVRLARAVGAEDRDPLAVPDLEVERLHQPGELEVLADDRALAGAAALEAHLHLLLARLLDRRTGLLELPQPRLRGLVARGHAVVVRSLLLVHEHERLELGVLLVPAAAHLLEPGEPVLARLVVRREAARVGPHQVARGAELDGDDPRRGVVEQLAVVADVEDRLVGLPDPALEPDLAGHVEEVVGLVEQQHLVGAGQEVLQHQPLLLAAGQRLQRRGTSRGRTARRALDRADVPRDLDVVAAGVGVLGQRGGVPHLGRLVVGLHQRPLAPVDLGRDAVRTRAGETESRRSATVGSVAEPDADHLAHDAEAPGAGHGAGVRRQLAGDDPAAASSCRRRSRRPARPSRPHRRGTTRRRAARGRPAARTGLLGRPRVPQGAIVTPIRLRIPAVFSARHRRRIRSGSAVRAEPLILP